MDGGESVYFSGGNHWLSVGQKDFLVLRNGLYLHSFLQLGGTHSRFWDNRLGTLYRARLPCHGTTAARRECRSEYDPGHVARVFCLLDRLGVAGTWADGF